MKKWLFIGCMWLAGTAVWAQGIMQSHERPLDFSARVGFNSAFPLIHSFTLDGADLPNRRVHYRVGYLAAVTLSVNFNRFFIQPSASWYRTNAEVRFSLPEAAGSSDALSDASLEEEVNSLEVPVLIGYHIVREAPYGLNVKFGPKGIYQYRSRYGFGGAASGFRFEGNNIPYAFNFVAAVGVTIGRLFLDFSYEFGLHNIRSTFTWTEPGATTPHTLLYERRTNLLSFSLGLNL